MPENLNDGLLFILHSSSPTYYDWSFLLVLLFHFMFLFLLFSCPTLSSSKSFTYTTQKLQRHVMLGQTWDIAPFYFIPCLMSSDFFHFITTYSIRDTNEMPVYYRLVLINVFGKKNRKDIRRPLCLMLLSVDSRQFVEM
jgi:hypothetical protein